jgi:hypothetical protein
MDAIERFVAEQNVWRFIDCLAHEANSSDKAVILHLLRLEEDKFAEAAGRFDEVERWISRCDSHIARHKALIDKAAPSADTSAAQRAIQSMIEIKSTMISLRRGMIACLEASAELPKKRKKLESENRKP